jgi:hypothetical protein
VDRKCAEYGRRGGRNGGGVGRGVGFRLGHEDLLLVAKFGIEYGRRGGRKGGGVSVTILATKAESTMRLVKQLFDGLVQRSDVFEADHDLCRIEVATSSRNSWVAKWAVQRRDTHEIW